MAAQKTKSDRFHEVATARTNRLLEDLRILSNCSNKNNYEYTEQEALQMFRAIELEVKNVKAMFLPTSRKRSVFSFDEQENQKGESDK
jgi:hypothetical protein